MGVDIRSLRSMRRALALPQFLAHPAIRAGLGPIQRTQKVWSGRIPRKGFTGQHRFWIKHISLHDMQDFRPEKSWFPIHLKPGLVKPWRGICPDHLPKAGEKLGKGKVYFDRQNRVTYYKPDCVSQVPHFRLFTGVSTQCNTVSL